MASSYEQMKLVAERLRQRPATVEDLVGLLHVNRRTIFRCLSRLEQDDKDFHKGRAQGRTRLYWIDSATPVGTKLAQQLSAMREELQSGGNHRYANLLKAACAQLSPSHAVLADPLPLQLDEYFILDHGPLSEYSDENSTKLVGRYLRSIHERRELMLRYRHADGSVESFLFQPLSVILRVGRLYLAGFRPDQKSKGPRVLLLRRILGSTATGQEFPPRQLDARSIYKHCFGAFLPQNPEQKPVLVKLEIRETWAESILTEAHFYPSVKITPAASQSFAIAELRIHILPDFISWIMGLQPAVRVLEPTSLAEEIQQRCSAALDIVKRGDSLRSSAKRT